MTTAVPPSVVPNVVTVACGALTWFFGVLVVKKVSILGKYNIPPAVVGGLLVAVAFEVLRQSGVAVPKFDTELINSLIIAFFASLGFGASVRVLREGGRAVIKYLAVCSIMLFVQAALGLGVAYALGQHPLFGVLTSIVSLAGGPGTALAFAPSFELAGVPNAASAGLAAAMGGLLLGGILGGPLGTILIERNNLVPDRSAKSVKVVTGDRSGWVDPDSLGDLLLWQNAYLLIVGSVGWYLSKYFAALGVTLPFYIGAMVIAALARNIDDATGWLKLNLPMIDAIGSACLTLFIATMMMSIELSAIASVAAVLLVMLLTQAIFVLLAAYTVMYYTSGRDYDAAVMSCGFIGFMLGTTATALAAMNSLSQKFGPAPRAFIVVPIVGACFIDFVNAIVISFFMNVFG